jgi:hypothetical protein
MTTPAPLARSYDAPDAPTSDGIVADSETADSLRPPARPLPFLAGLGVVTSATLALEVLDTRLLSVITWYSLAFLVIAMGLFGLTAGAVHVYLAPADFEGPQLMAALARAARRFALAVPVSLGLLLAVPLTTAPVFTTVVVFLVFAAALSLPFYPAGVVVAAALTRTQLPIGRVYAVDLIGAALGAPMVFLLLKWTSGETAILLVGALAASSSLLFAIAGSDRSALRAGYGVLVVTLGLSVANVLTPYGLKPIWVKGRLDGQDYDVEVWNSHSRIRVFKPAVLPALVWGGGDRCTLPPLMQHVIQIDAGAGTTLYEAPGGIESLQFLQCDVTNVAGMLRPGGAAGIIGVGGSRDLQAALLSKHAPVYGIEFNGRMLEILRGPIGLTSGVPTHPDVRLVEDEGRSFMARTNLRFRLIQASLVDTWAATGAGAHALGENGLYTVEAWRTFLDRLEPDGVLTVSRWTQETLRVASLAMGTLLDAGVTRPRDHLAFVGTTEVVTVILSKMPMTDTDGAYLKQIGDKEGFFVVGPGWPSGNPLLEAVLGAKSRSELDAATLTKDVDFRPPTDDRPYFFNVLPLEAAWRTLPVVNMGSILGNQLATRTLVLSFLCSLILVTGAIVVPLLRRARPRGRGGPRLWAGLAYFLFIGVGFMLVEITLLQRLGLVLGQPSYSLIVVITSLVGSTGLGALASDRLPLSRAPYCFLFPLVIAVALAGVSLLWPALLPHVMSKELGTRVAFALAVTSVLGVLLGVAFPTGIRLVSTAHRDETPWLWGMNGVGSVLASSLGIMIAQRYGLTVALLFAAAVYATMVLPIWVLVTDKRAA